MGFLSWETEISSGICECDYDCQCFDQFEEDFVDHMDTHAEEINAIRAKLYKMQTELLKEVF